MYLGYDDNKLGSNFPQRESKGQNMKLKSLVKQIKENAHEEAPQMNKEQKQQFLENIKSFNKYGEAIYRTKHIVEALNEIRSIVEGANTLTLQETGDWFDKVTVNRHMKQLQESFKTFEKTANEMYTLQQRLEACYEDMGNTLNKYYDINSVDNNQL